MVPIALVYDADYTLMDGYHPSVVLEQRGMDVDAFWNKVIATQQLEKKKGDKTSKDIIYLAHFMHEIRYGQLKGLRIKDLAQAGKALQQHFYPGIPDFFVRVTNAHPYARVSHNIVSVGIKTILEHSPLGEHADTIFGYSFFDDLTDNETIDEIKGTSSSQEKIPAIVAISYGKGQKNGEYEFPIKNMIYFGDGQTDKPAFRFVAKRGGLAICVYDPRRPGAFEKAQQLKEDVHYIVPADYQYGQAIWHIVHNFISTRYDELKKR
ncbi:hypothetical protein GF342_01035 [Candidatus Woesearchaeota archaeon]|nr:hypothetical protein [Candidatus Woesearchaeota archaeon]